MKTNHTKDEKCQCRPLNKDLVDTSFCEVHSVSTKDERSDVRGIAEKVEEMRTITCKTCNGDGYTVGYDPRDPTGETPMQAQCDDCHAEGKYTTLDEVRTTLTQLVKEVEAGEQQRVMDMVRYYSKDAWSEVWDCINAGVEPYEWDNMTDEKRRKALTPPTSDVIEK